MAKNIDLKISLGLPGRRLALPLLFLLILCMPAVADNTGVTTVKTYYPIAYGSLDKPKASKFEMKLYTVYGGSACARATMAISAGANINLSGGTLAFVGESIEIEKAGTSPAANVSYGMDNLFLWATSASVAALGYTTSPTNATPAGPYWTPICNGASTGGGYICDFAGTTSTYRLFIRADVRFATMVSGTLQFFTDPAMLTPASPSAP